MYACSESRLVEIEPEREREREESAHMTDALRGQSELSARLSCCSGGVREDSPTHARTHASRSEQSSTRSTRERRHAVTMVHMGQKVCLETLQHAPEAQRHLWTYIIR